MKRRYLGLVHIATLSCFAFAEPLLDLLARQAEFLVVRSIPRGDVIILVLILLMLLPLPAILLSWLSTRIGDRLGAWVTAIVLGGLFGVIALRSAKALAIAGAAAILVAIAAGAAFAWAVRRVSAVGFALSVLSGALALVPLLFFLDGNVRRALSEESGYLARDTELPAPLIIVVLDEISFTSLLDRDGNLNRRRLPHLASFAERSTWYKNAVASGDATEIVVPALLTGRLPTEITLPNRQAHPKNLFTLIGHGAPVFAVEPITSLCPPEINQLRPAMLPLHERMGKLMSDLAIVWLHMVVPAPWQDRLPSVSSTWQDFAATRPFEPRQRDASPRASTTASDRVGDFRAFVESIHGDAPPSVHFAHVLLPHRPWEYLPSGRRYTAPSNTPTLRQGPWDDAPNVVAQGFQRYLAQLGLVDRLLGELFDHLHAEELFDRSLIVITADHGISFRPGDERRTYTPTNVSDVLPVPLFIKAPNQQESAVIEQSTSSIDVLPTVASMLATELPWPHDGHARTGDPADVPVARTFLSKHHGGLPIPPDLHDEKYRALARREALMGQAIDEPEDIFRIGPRPELVGRALGSFPTITSGAAIATLQGPALYDAVDPGAPFVPAMVQGEVRSADTGCCDLAIAVGGTIFATTWMQPSSSPRRSFSALLTERAFRPGRNKVDVLAVSGPRDAPRLEMLQQRRRRSYRLVETSASGQAAIEIDDERYPIGARLEGWFTDTIIEDDLVVTTGWAVDCAGRRLPDELAVFYEDRFVYAGPATVDRPDVALRFDDQRLERSGFRFEIPLSRVPDLRDRGLRVFALSMDGQASELGFFFNLGQQRRPDGSEHLRAGNGRHFRVLPGPAQAWLDNVFPVADSPEDLIFTGWAGDPETGQLPDRIVVLHNGQHYTHVGPHIDRPDVVAALGQESLLRSGFQLQLPVAALNAFEQRSGRVFALFFHQGTAVEAQFSPAVASARR